MTGASADMIVSGTIIETGAGGVAALIWMERGAVAVCTGEDESVTVTVKSKVPAIVGEPVMAPDEVFKVSPGGRVPGGTLQV
jgi:hypothetical protein